MKRNAGIIVGLIMILAMAQMTGTVVSAQTNTQNQKSITVDETYVGSENIDITSDDRPKADGDQIITDNKSAATNIGSTGSIKSGKTGKSKVSASSKGANAGAVNYSYKIKPLLPPFNRFFFVETDNPDPKSFRFADKSSVYSDNSVISLDWDSWDEVINIYSDIKYEDETTGRVDGGYIFYSGNTDGGELTLQEEENPNTWRASWVDTEIKASLPALKDNVDYLVDTYADKDSFFDNMDAVQTGFSSVCLYSGSYVRGELTRQDEYWFAASAGHIDQSFYIYSPYERKASKSLFASAIYPFRYDSLGFPSMMGAVAERLDSSATYKWNSGAHYLIDVTYNGETRSFGGQGNGKGQGISEDKILQYFSFGKDSTEITLDGDLSLLKNYAALEMEDDIPRDDALTWKQIYDTVGTGSWARLSGTHSKMNGKWNLGSVEYAYFYQNGDGNFFSDDEWGVGYNLYWGGDLGYARDTWVDGRYIGEWRVFEPGAKFQDHPTSKILLTDVAVPQIAYTGRYEYNNETGKYNVVYEIKSISEESKTVLFTYQDGEWTPSYNAFNDGCAGYNKIKEFVEQGQIDQKYLDMVTITQDEIPALNLDRNTNTVPDKGYCYDGFTAPGTPFDESAGHCWNNGEIIEESTCDKDGSKALTCLVCGEKKTVTVPAKGHTWDTEYTIDTAATCSKNGSESIHCSVCNAIKEGTERTIPVLSHTWNTEMTVDKKPTYTEEGVQSIHCAICGQIKDNTQQVIPMLEKLANPMSVKVATKTVKVDKLKKKAQTVTPITVKKAKGTVTYKIVGDNSKSRKALKINAKVGKVTVRKGTKKGTYKVNVAVNAAGTNTKSPQYKSASKIVQVTVKVK